MVSHSWLHWACDVCPWIYIELFFFHSMHKLWESLQPPGWCNDTHNSLEQPYRPHYYTGALGPMQTAGCLMTSPTPLNSRIWISAASHSTILWNEFSHYQRPWSSLYVTTADHHSIRLLSIFLEAVPKSTATLKYVLVLHFWWLYNIDWKRHENDILVH